MAVRKFLARNHRFFINTDSGDYDAGTWVAVSGISSWSWSEDSSDADSSDFDNAGWTSSFVVSRGTTLGFEGQYLVDEATGARDSGQLLCEQGSKGFGPTAFKYLKVEAVNTARTTPIGSIIVLGSLSQGETGGGMEDIQAFSIEAMVQGKPIGSGIYNIFDLA